MNSRKTNSTTRLRGTRLQQSDVNEIRPLGGAEYSSNNRNNDQKPFILLRSNRSRQAVTATSSPYHYIGLFIIYGLIGMVVLATTFILFLSNISSSAKKVITAHDIYCHGPILHAVQMSAMFDGKDFVDRPMKRDPAEIYIAFKQLPEKVDNDQLRNFLDTYFDQPGSDLVPVLPTDYRNNPEQLISSIVNETLLDWAISLNQLWKVLGRMPTVGKYPQRHSFLPTRHILMVPGGRFRESYYWDTYWIVIGLITCGMRETARGVVQNLLDFVHAYGFVPNGGRIYYLTRSQPPMLSEMIRVLMDDRLDLTFLEKSTWMLEKEYQFWMSQRDGTSGHAIKVRDKYVLNRYVSLSTEPRPESYREDVLTTQGRSTVDAKKKLYSNLIAGAETGWDFSSRWFKDHQNINTTITSRIVPVDLNCIMHRMEKNMEQFYTLLKNESRADFYTKAATRRQEAMDAIFWSERYGMWIDHMIDHDIQSPVIAASNYFPLWSKSFDTKNKTRVTAALQSLSKSGLIQAGGVQTSTLSTGEQWDGPNAWAPIQDLLIDGLLEMKHEKEEEKGIARVMANDLIRRWVRMNYISWKSTGHMYEKYNAVTGESGGGGEYVIQVGFGWTNGVILKLLTQHGAILNNL